MAIALALLELGSLFVVVSGALAISTHPVIKTWLDVLGLAGQSVAVTLCCLVCFYYNDLYDLRLVRSLGEFVPRLLKSLLLAFAFLTLFHTLFPQHTVTGQEFLASLVLLAVVLLSMRAVAYGVMRRRLFAEPVLVLGTGPLAQSLVDELDRAPEFRYRVMGLVDEDASPDSGGRYLSGVPVLGTIDDVQETIRQTKPARVVVALKERRGRLPVRDLLAFSMNGTVVEDGIEVFERVTGKLAIENLTPSALLFSGAFKKPRLRLAARRVLNITLALMALVVAAPLMALIAFFIRMESRGPIFFIQDRIGLRGTRFRLLKFRTMTEPEEEESESVWNRDNRSRLTRFGRWLRDWHLDEIPQFVNVLAGDMNLVGPRPEMASNVEEMEQEIPYYSIRHSVRPGITGWAQVRHHYALSREDVTEKIRYDLYYIKNMSLWLDLRILVDTVKIVLLRNGVS